MLFRDDLRFFEVIAASPSLAAASRRLDVTASAVTQRLRQIEQRLSIRLVERTGRSLQLTDEGALLLERSRVILEDIQALETELAERRSVVSGRLRVAAPLGFGRRYISPLMVDYCRLFPSVEIELWLSDRPGRDDFHGWDMLVSIGDSRNSSLIGQRIAPNDRIICAAPEYLAVHGMPQTPDDLRHHKCIALRENEEDVTMWRFEQAQGEQRVNVRVEPAFASNDGEIVKAWGLAGLGVIVRSEWHVAEDIAAGRLVRLLPDWQLPDADVVVLMRNRHGRSARTLKFLEFLRAAFRPVPWRLEH